MLRDDAGEKERRTSIGNSGKDSKEGGRAYAGSETKVGERGPTRRGDGTRRENACQLDNSTSTSRP